MGLPRSVVLIVGVLAASAGASALAESEIRGPWVSPHLTESWETVEMYSTPVYRYYIEQGWYVPPGMTQSQVIDRVRDPGAGSSALDPPFSANVKISDDTGTGSQNEVSMDVDTNGNLYAGWNDNRKGNYECGYTQSSDDGKTWSANELYKTKQFQGGDPVIVADRAGNLYRLCMGFGGGAFSFATSKSSDGGKTWTAWVEIPGWDKPWMAAHEGKLIIIGMNNGLINQVRSMDDGQTWDTPKSIGGEQGACIVNDASGNLYAAWGLNTVKFVKSSDWGDSWSAPVNLGQGSSIHGSPRSASLTTCDVSDDGQNVYVGWSRQSGGGDEVVVAASGDGGATFSAPVKVNDGAASSRAILPWTALDSGGKVHAAWLDNRNGIGDAFYSNSTDGGKTWAANARVSDASPGKPWVSFIGDYTQLVVTPKGEAAYAFCENREGDSDIYFASAAVASGGAQLARIEVSPVAPTVDADRTQQFTAQGFDTSNQPTSVKPQWAVAGGSIDPASGLYTPDKVGTFHVTATVGKVVGHANVTVTPGAVVTITVDPPSASITADDTQQFAAKGADAKGNDVTLNPQWSATGGGIDSSGLFTPAKVGTFTVTATDQGKSGTGAVAVTPGKPVSLEIRPPTATVKADETFDFAAVGIDAKGNHKNLTASWKLTGGADAGSIAPTGKFTPDKVGDYDITAEAQGMTADGKVSVVPGKLAALAVEPKNTTVYVGESVQYTAVGKDVKGNLIRTLSVDWQATTAPGTVTKDGSFRAARPGGGKVLATGTDGAATETAEAFVTVKEDPLAFIGGSAMLIPLLLIIVIAIVGAGVAMALLKRRRRGARTPDQHWQGGGATGYGEFPPASPSPPGPGDYQHGWYPPQPDPQQPFPQQPPAQQL